MNENKRTEYFILLNGTSLHQQEKNCTRENSTASFVMKYGGVVDWILKRKEVNWWYDISFCALGIFKSGAEGTI